MFTRGMKIMPILLPLDPEFFGPFLERLFVLERNVQRVQEVARRARNVFRSAPATSFFGQGLARKLVFSVRQRSEIGRQLLTLRSRHLVQQVLVENRPRHRLENFGRRRLGLFFEVRPLGQRPRKNIGFEIRLFGREWRRRQQRRRPLRRRRRLWRRSLCPVNLSDLVQRLKPLLAVQASVVEDVVHLNQDSNDNKTSFKQCHRFKSEICGTLH